MRRLRSERRPRSGIRACLVLCGLLLASSGVGSNIQAAEGPPPGVDRAADLRVRLSRSLGEHVFLTVEAMRAGIGAPDELPAAAESLEANTVDLAALIGSVYGDEASARFGELWRSHIGYLVDYTSATAEGDEAARAIASEGLEQYQTDLAEFFSAAMPSLEQEHLRHLIGEHVLLLTQLGDSVEADYDAAYDAARQAYRHMFDLGRLLAEAIAARFPETFPGPEIASSPALELRVTLDRLLGEHTFLAVEAMRATAGDHPQTASARRALDENSTELQDVIASLYGDDAAASFRTAWDEHVGAYIAYIEAIRDSDIDAAATARTHLEGFADAFGELFGTEHPGLGREDAAALARSHAEHLIGQVDAYHAGDHTNAYAIARDAYRQTQVISDVLARAMAARFPEIFPPLPPTAMAVTEPPQIWPAVIGGIAACLLVLAAFHVRSRRSAG